VFPNIHTTSNNNLFVNLIGRDNNVTSWEMTSGRNTAGTFEQVFYLSSQQFEVTLPRL